VNDLSDSKQGEVLGTFLFELAGIKVGLSVIDEDYKKKTERLKERKKEIERELDRLMEQIGVDSFKNEAGTASRKVNIFPNIKDFEQLVQFIAETGNYALLKKAVNSKPFRDIIEIGESVPGVDNYVDSKINFSVNPTFRDSFIKQGE